MIRFSPTMLAIRNDKQFFVDDLIIETVHETTRTFHQPEKIPQSPVIVRDKPWEKVTYFSGGTHNVFADPQDGMLKCLYCDFRLDRDDWKRRGVLDPTNHNMTVNYACSEDGITWDKPSLGLRKENGHDTNVIFGQGTVEEGCVYCFCPVFNPHEQDPKKRLRTIYFGWNNRRGIFQNLAYSSDGIHWTPSNEPATWGGAAGIGDVVAAHYDTSTRQYVASVRHHHMSDVQLSPRNPKGAGYLAFEPHYPLDFAKVPKRMVWQVESGDFVHWTDPHLILAPEDGFDNIDDEFYGMCQYPTGNIKLGFLNVFHKALNTMDVQLVYTRDGYSWHRLNKGQPFLTSGPSGTWDQCQVTIMSRPIERGNELYFFHGGSQSHHDWWMSGPVEGLDAPEVHDFSKVGYGLGVAKLRLDGFVSLDSSPVRESVIVTRPFISDGTTLIINAKVAKGGYLDVEVVDGADEPITGCSRRECDSFRGDSVRHVVTWNGNRAIGTGAVQQGGRNHFRKLRVFMRKASLYSFQMVDPGQTDQIMKFPGMGWNTG